MKRFLALCILVFVGVATWIIGSKLSADAIGMGVGVAFGVMAGIPTALLLLASNRRSAAERTQQLDAPPRYPHYPQQPPVIVLTGGVHQTPPEYSPYGGQQGYAPPRCRMNTMPSVRSPCAPRHPSSATGAKSTDGSCAGNMPSQRKPPGSHRSGRFCFSA